MKPWHRFKKPSKSGPWEKFKSSGAQEPHEFSAMKMVKNIPASGAALVKDIAHAVTSPIETGKNLGALFTGAVQHALPSGLQAASAEPQRQMASAVGGFFKNRYGSADAALKTLESDPVGALADASIVLTGGAGAASRVPILGKSLGTAARVTNPLYLAGKAAEKTAPAVGRVVSDLVGTIGTHTGGESVRAAYRAGRSGGKGAETFTAHLRGNAPIEEVVDRAKAALSQIRQERGAAYRSGMVQVSKDKTVLDFGPIDDAFAKSKEVGTYKGKTLDPSTVETRQKIAAALDEWRSADPADFRTPEGLDALKQRLWDVASEAQHGSRSHKVAMDMYSAVKREITKQAPNYAKVMADYERGSELISEIERALSLGHKASVDTALRKLQSVLRNSVNTNYGKRLDLVRRLEGAGAIDLRAALAGQAMNQWAPRGLGTAAIPTGAGFVLGGLPVGLATLALQSPRLAGEASYLLGRGTRAASGIPIGRPEVAGLLLSEAERLKR